MPVFPSQNLNSQKICESYPKLLQIYNNDIVLDGTGSQVQLLNVTASYALNGGTTLYTGSTYPITSSWALNALNSNYAFSASYATNCLCAGGNSVTGSFCSSSVWTFNHNLGNQYVIIQTFDENNNQIIPEVVNLYDDNTAVIAFGENVCGIAVASLGGKTKTEITKSFFYGKPGRYWFNCEENMEEISGSMYFQLSVNAVNMPQHVVTSSLTSSLSPQLVSQYVTDVNYPGVNYIQPDNWFFYLHAYLSNQVDGQLVYLYCEINKLDTNNNQTFLFNSDLVQVNSNLTQFETVISEIFYPGGNVLDVTDRLILNIYAVNETPVNCTLYLASQGTQHYSYADTPLGRTDIDYSTGSLYPITSSWALNALNAGTPLYTGSTYPITASWALYTVTSSYIQVSNVSYPIKTVTNDYNVTQTDYTILCNASSNGFNVKLPSAASVNSQIFNIKKIDTTGNRIQVYTSAGNYIDYDVTQSIAHRGTNMSLQSDGSQYWIL